MPLIPLSHLGPKPEPERRYRFMETVRRAMRERRFSARTEEAYAGWIRRYIIFNERRHPGDLTEADVVRFLSNLAVEQCVSASTQNQAFAALAFLYSVVLRRPLRAALEIFPAARPRRVPVVLSADEIRRVLGFLREPDCLVVSLLYGSGLRILECLSLRIKDIHAFGMRSTSDAITTEWPKLVEKWLHTIKVF